MEQDSSLKIQQCNFIVFFQVSNLLSGYVIKHNCLNQIIQQNNNTTVLEIKYGNSMTQFTETFNLKIGQDKYQEEASLQLSLHALIRGQFILDQEKVHMKNSLENVFGISIFQSQNYNLKENLLLSTKAERDKEEQNECMFYLSIQNIHFCSVYQICMRNARDKSDNSKLKQFINELISIKQDHNQHQELINQYENNQSLEQMSFKIKCLKYLLTNPAYFILNSEIDSVCLFSNSIFAINYKIGKGVMMSGSFNPVHQGHIDIAERGAMEAGVDKRRDVYFEIAINNADKGEKVIDELIKRAELIFNAAPEFKVIISKKTFFYQKCDLAHDCSFVMGMDTFTRLMDLKYYNNSKDELIMALSKLVQNNIKLILIPRYNTSSQILETLETYLSDHSIPKIIAGILRQINYRNDISSTQLRHYSSYKDKF